LDLCKRLGIREEKFPSHLYDLSRKASIVTDEASKIWNSVQLGVSWIGSNLTGFFAKNEEILRNEARTNTQV
jgi:hypothetical protein